MEIWVQNETEMASKVVPALLQFEGGHRFYVFNGAMGAGKTTTIKSLCAHLGVTENVSSPTFSLVNEYQSPSHTLYHFDFYRIKSIEEAYDIGYEEYFYSNAICMVEWGEKIQSLLPEIYVDIHIEIISAQARKYTFTLISNP